ncbi:MAG: hypothetical protein K0Q59_1722 [Paenibacillus sp.]|jgi:polysaccharide pyruvyl transferase WcaK-like protein|nr:hypothetical protein [Paenibacillus sp.]
MMNICICGYYGMGNFGDELFLETFRQTMAGHRVFPWAPYMDISRIDAVVIGGGDLITPYKFNTFYFPSGLEKLPLWVYGVGIVDYYPPKTWPEAEVEKYRAYLSQAKQVCLRDERSTELARGIRLHDRISTVPDVAFGLREPGFPIRRFSSLPTIGLCIFAYKEFPLQKVIELGTKWCKDGYAVVLLPVVNQSNNPYADAALCKQVKEGIAAAYPRAQVLHPGIQYDLQVAYSYVQSVDLLVSFKLHPALVGLRGGIPTLCLTKMSKVRSLFEAYALDDFVLNYEQPIETIRERFALLARDGKARLGAASSKLRQTEAASSASLNALRREIESTVNKPGI